MPRSIVLKVYDCSDARTRSRLPLSGLVTIRLGRILMSLPAMWSVLLCLHLGPAEDLAVACFVRQRLFFIRWRDPWHALWRGPARRTVARRQ